MADIVIADTTRHYDGRYLGTHPLGATESSVIHLARELARRGHNVTAFTNCDGTIEDEGVRWRPLPGPPGESCDLYIAIQHPELLGFVPHARRRALWVLWQPEHLEHYTRILSMWRYRPIPVLAPAWTADHAATAATAQIAFGKGNGRGGALNLLDLMVYAVAKDSGMPLLCTGRDFASTDAHIHPSSRVDRVVQ